MMNNFILAGLLGNASSLGVHWIYDAKYLEELSILKVK
jgi:hypothetical protein